jgi:hypothetical protein
VYVVERDGNDVDADERTAALSAGLNSDLRTWNFG